MELFKHSPIHGGVPGRDFDGLQAEVAMELAEYQLQKHERKPWHSTTGDIDQSKCFCYFVQCLIFMLFQIAGLPEDEIVNGGDIRVRQSRKHLGFTNKRIARERSGFPLNLLQCDLSPKETISRGKHLPHPSLT